MSDPAPRRRRPAVDAVLRWLGWLAHVGLGVFPTSASGLLAPGWAVVVIVAVWGAAAVVAWRVGRRRPRWTPAVPLGYLLFWIGFLLAGDQLLGWTA